MLYEKSFFVVCCVVVLCFVSSCVKYHKFLEPEVPQGYIRDDKRELVYNNVRSTSVYDEFATVAIFDALAMSGEVRSAYVDLYCDRRGLSKDLRCEMANKQIEDSSNNAVFYVLADIRDKGSALLHEKNPFWAMFLKLEDGTSVEANSIKEVELEPELQMFFGKKFNQFKTAYMVQFPATSDGNMVHVNQMSKYSLVIGSPYRKCELVWDMKDRKERSQVKKHEDFYWS